MTPTTYGRIESGQHTQTRKLQDIADVFAVEIDAVLSPPATLVDDRLSLEAIVARVRRELAAVQPTYEQAMENMHRVTRERETREARQEHSNSRKKRAGRKK